MKTIIRNFLSVLRRFKMATALNVLGLSVAFAAFMVIMMQVDYDLSFNKSIKDADRIYRVEAETEGRQLAVLPRPLIDDFKAASPYVEAAAITNGMSAEMHNWSFSVEQDENEKYYSEKVLNVSADFVHVIHFDMTEGTADKITEPETVLIPLSMSRKLFGEGSAVQKRLVFEDHTYTIGGVYQDFPANSSIKNYIYVKIPDNENKGNWNSFNYEGYVKIKPGADMEKILETYVAGIDKEQLVQLVKDLRFCSVPLEQIHFNTKTEFDSVEKVSKQTVWVLVTIAFVILLIAAINFTNYSIALTPLRIKSINTQKVLGASGKRLRGSLLVEAICICFVSWGIALLFTHLLSLTSVAQIVDVDMALGRHLPLIGVVGCLALLVGIFAGVYPAYYITSFTPALVLKGSFGLSPKGRQLRNVLVSVQFVASFVLIVAAVFMYLQVHFMQYASLGFDKDQVIVANLNEKAVNSRNVLSNELKKNSSIESVSFSEVLLSGLDSYSTWKREFKGEDRMFQILAVDTGFLRTMGIPLQEGRDLLPSDGNGDNPVFIFNEKAKKMYNLSIGDKTSYGEEVVGFIPDIMVTSLRKEVEPMAFSCIIDKYSIGRNWAYIRVKAGSDMKQVMQHIRSSLDKLTPGYPFNVLFYDQVLNNVYTKESSLTSLITWFSLIAVLISMVGVFGLVVFESEYKRKEIGVRRVLGSTIGEILAMFNRRYVKILGICFVVSTPIAWYAIHTWLENFAYKTPIYWWVFALSFLVVTMITTATVTFQSWHVANANPVESIKTE